MFALELMSWCPNALYSSSVVGRGEEESALRGAAALAGRLLRAISRGELDAPERLIRLLTAVRKVGKTRH